VRTTLTGRKERFYADRCRMAARRDVQAARIHELLDTIRAIGDALEVECIGRKAATP
jgi:hypothetical protein